MPAALPHVARAAPHLHGRRAARRGSAAQRALPRPAPSQPRHSQPACRTAVPLRAQRAGGGGGSGAGGGGGGGGGGGDNDGDNAAELAHAALPPRTHAALLAAAALSSLEAFAGAAYACLIGVVRVQARAHSSAQS
jgi:hypothetical protein